MPERKAGVTGTAPSPYTLLVFHRYSDVITPNVVIYLSTIGVRFSLFQPAACVSTDPDDDDDPDADDDDDPDDDYDDDPDDVPCDHMATIGFALSSREAVLWKETLSRTTYASLGCAF